MGIRGLYSYLKHYRNAFDVRTKTKSLRIGIDAMSFLYRYKEQKEDILSVLRTLKSLGHIVFFIFDGKAPIEKSDELNARKEHRETAANNVSKIESFLESDSGKNMDGLTKNILEDSLNRYKSKSWNASRTIRRAFQDVLWDENIPYVKSISEADDVIIDLYNGGKLDVVMSSDMDYLVAGVQYLWIPSHKGIFWFEEVVLNDILRCEEISLAQLNEIGTLCTLYGILCEKAFTWIRHYGSIKSIMMSKSLTFNKSTSENIEYEVERLKPQEVYSRIRPDHLERVKDILDNL